MSKKNPMLTDIEHLELKDSITQTIDDVNVRKNIGTFILCTDRNDLSHSDVYRRQEIEQSFKGYDDALGCTASYMWNNVWMECWLFINHIALQMEYRMLKEISSLDLTRKYSFKDTIKHLSSIRANKIGSKWHVCSVAGKTRRFCDERGFKYPLSLNTEP